MKTLHHIPGALVLSFLFLPGLFAQSSFSVAEYMQFRAEHRDMTPEALLLENPARTTYYASRQYPADLNRIPWFDTLNRAFTFTEDELSFIRQNHFMVSERLNHHDWAYGFIQIYGQDLPLFLSSDFILETLHRSYDAILQTMEWQFLEPNLKDLLHALYEGVPALAARWSEDSRLKEAVSDVDLYVSVALSLAEGEQYPPRTTDPGQYTAVMEAIAAEEQVDMALFTEEPRTRKLDFSQFTVRGHYDKVINFDGQRFTLENYFRAMMWLGRIDFLMTAPPENPWEPDWKPEELRRMQQGALLLNELLYTSGKLENLEKHEEIISFMVGPDDNLTPAELRILAEDLSPAALFDETKYESFSEALNASDDYGQKIMSNFFLVNPDTTDPGQLPVSFRLLGQKFLIDSYVFSEVVYDRIIFEGQKIWRPLPDPLDAMAALGNEDALALLAGEMDHYKYASNMAGLRYLVESYDPEFWEQSLYNTWLAALRSLNPPASVAGLPYFMQTVAWHHQKLNTQLTSWAQLRHDNILYGKQSYTGGTGCSFPLTYVEPCVEMFDRLAAFARNASDFIEAVFEGIPFYYKESIISYYKKYGELMEELEGISRKELSGQVLSEDEIVFLKTMINGYMASGPSISGWFNDLFYEPWKALEWDYTVADVHTQPTDESGNRVGNVLHVGNGLINTGVFLAPNPCNPGQLVAFAGPVSSFHYRVEPDFNRLNDEDWKNLFLEETIPGRPDWVASYLLDRKGKAYPDARELKGSIYTGTDIEPGVSTSPADYMLVFPNPASNVAGLRMLLNSRSDLDVRVYDAAGREIFGEAYPDLAPAEYHFSLPVEDWQPGLYLVRANLGGKLMVSELVVR